MLQYRYIHYYLAVIIIFIDVYKREKNYIDMTRIILNFGKGYLEFT